MKLVPKKYLVLLFFASLTYTFLVNQLNYYFIRKYNPANESSNARSLVYNSTIYSIDNYWYVNHVKNLLKYNRFTVDISKPLYEVRRTPVYPLFYGLHYIAAGEEGSYYYIRFTQAILLALAVVALFMGMYHFTENKTIAWLAALTYGLFPPVAIATSFTNAESINSELVCYCIFFLSLCKTTGKNKYYFLSGLSFALAVLCRPSIIFMALSCVFAIIFFNRHNIKKSISGFALFIVGALLLFAPWTIRNYRVTKGEFVFLEKYYGDPMDYGMPNIHLRKWIGCWENPADMSSEQISNAMIGNINSPDKQSKEEIVSKYIRMMPRKAFIGNSKETIEASFYSLYDYYETKSILSDKKALAAKEEETSAGFISLKNNFIRESPINYYLITPLNFAGSVIFQSNSTSLAFLDNYTGNWIKMGVKGILYLVNVFSFLAMILLLFKQRKYASFYWIAVLFIGLSFAGIIYSLRYYEARYNFPLFPLLFGLFSILITEILLLFKKAPG